MRTYEIPPEGIRPGYECGPEDRTARAYAAHVPGLIIVEALPFGSGRGWHVTHESSGLTMIPCALKLKQARAYAKALGARLDCTKGKDELATRENYEHVKAARAEAGL